MTNAANTRLRWTVVGLLLICAAGCQSYGEVSPTAYEYAKALYSISNRQAEHKLDEVTEQINVSQQNGELPESEAEWLRDIVDNARQGEWKLANQASRQMMEDQVQHLP